LSNSYKQAWWNLFAEQAVQSFPMLPAPLIDDHQVPADAEVADAHLYEFPYKNWADITRHKPSKPITISHVERGTMRLQKTHIGRPRKRKRIRITPPKTTDYTKGSEVKAVK